MSSRALISVQELNDCLPGGRVRLIDTREPLVYDEAHIPGASNLREVFTYLAGSTLAEAERLAEKLSSAFGAAGLSGAEKAVVYEQSMDTGFGQSCRGYVLLRHLGYPDVRVLDGGFDAWKRAGLPLQCDRPIIPTARFPSLRPRKPLLVSLEEMKAAVRAMDSVLLDVRDVDEWIGDSSSPYGADFCPRKGRIPGAVWIEWYRFMKPTSGGPRFKSPDEVLAECASVGIRRETPVIIYCFKGARASNVFVALEEAGLTNVRIYFGSWNEWSRDPALPIETGHPF